MISRVVRYAGPALLCALSACATHEAKQTTPQQDESIVAKKAQARWDALIKEDLDEAYTYLSPGTRSTVPLKVYRKKIRFGYWKKATVDKVSCEAERCKVSVIISLRNSTGADPIDTYANELWVKESSDWWYLWK